MYACPTTPYYGADAFFGGFPTKSYSSVFNKETPATPFDRMSSTFCPTTFDRVPGYPSTFDRFPSTWGRFPSTWERSTMTGFPSTWERFPSTWERSAMTGFPSTYERFPATWGAFPGAERFNTFARSATCPINNTSMCSTTFRPSSEVEWFTLTNPIRFFEDGTRGLWLCFDLRGYKPEEVCVSINKTERCIIVEASHDVKEHGISRKFSRKWALPEYMSKMDITKIEFKSFFGPDGLLYVEGVLPRCEESNSWPAYPWIYSCWTNPTWAAVANKWNNSNNWCNNEWCNTAYAGASIKAVTCKLI